MTRYLILPTVLVLIASCQQQVAIEGDKLFTQLPESYTGVGFANDLEENIYTRENVLSFEYYYNGGGVAIGDINSDGLQDILLTGNMVPNRLYLNKGKLKFEDITESSGINARKNWSTGAVMADVNQDGHLDIYICQAGPSLDLAQRENLLYINNGDLTFAERGADYGLNDQNLSTHAGFMDYDKDGDLDCFVMNESKYFRHTHGTCPAGTSEHPKAQGGKFEVVSQ